MTNNDNVNIYAIYDSKAEAYLAPFTTRNDGLAARMFEAAVNDPSSNFAKWPGDYTLFCVGEFNEHTGQVAPITHRNLGTAVQYLQASEPFHEASGPADSAAPSEAKVAAVRRALSLKNPDTQNNN